MRRLGVTLVGTLIAISAVGATAAPSASWRVVPDPHFGTLAGIDAVSSNDMWAVGYYYDQPQGRNLPLAEHWNGSAWTALTLPSDKPGYNVLNAVSAVSSNDVWAVGSSTPRYYSYLFFPMIQHWDGTSWKVIPSPNVGQGELKGVAAVAADDVWAVGTQGYPQQGVLVEHWNGTAWAEVDAGHSDDAGSLNGISARTAEDIWAVGSYLGGWKTLTLAEHWDGTAWATVATPSPMEYNDLLGVSVDPTGSGVWAVGSQNPGVGYHALTERFDGTSWSVSEIDSSIPHLYGVVSLSPTSAWAVGYGADLSPLTQRWNGSTWSEVPDPVHGLQILYAITSAGRTLWTVGDNLIMRRP